MRQPVKFAELHAPLFHAGKNHGLKLHAKPGLKLWYDRTEKELMVEWENRTSYLPSTSVHSYELMDDSVIPVEEPKLRVPPTKKIKAQVSGPHDHVFRGEGHGRTKD